MIYTIGHSTLSQSDFLKLLPPDLDVILDVRSHPTSKWEQFRQENMEKWLPANGIKYELELDLGGWTEEHAHLAPMFASKKVDVLAYSKGKFPKHRIGINSEELKSSGKPVWYNQGLWDYQWFMTLPQFMDAAFRLIKRSSTENVGILCCECLWWKCHRSMISDFMVFVGSNTTHLQPKMTEHSNVISDRIDRYDQEVLDTWKKILNL